MTPTLPEPSSSSTMSASRCSPLSGALLAAEKKQTLVTFIFSPWSQRVGGGTMRRFVDRRSVFGCIPMRHCLFLPRRGARRGFCRAKGYPGVRAMVRRGSGCAATRFRSGGKGAQLRRRPGAPVRHGE